MGIFSYEAKSLNGETRKGREKARHSSEVTDKLKKKGFKVTRMVEIEETLATKDIQLFNKIKMKKVVPYLQQLSTLIEAGVSITEASNMLVEQEEHQPFKAVLIDISESLQGGSPLSVGYENHPQAFPPMLISIIRSAEASGTLESSLTEMAIFFEKKEKSKNSMVTAMIYPILMLIVSLGVGAFLLTSIVPMFVEVFESMETELPAITKVTMAMSDFLKTKSLFLLVAFGAVGISYKIACRKESFLFKRDSVVLKIPLLGELIQKNNMSMLMNTLATLLASSVPVSKALELAKDSMANLYIKQLVVDCQLEIEQGGLMSDVFMNSWAVPGLVSQMLKVGETTGALEGMLAKLSVIYEAEVETASERIKTVMEPVIILLIAGMVGFIVAAIMLPMFAMYDAVQG